MQQPSSPVSGGVELTAHGPGGRQEQQEGAQGRHPRHNHRDDGGSEGEGTGNSAQEQQGDGRNPRLIKDGSISSSQGHGRGATGDPRAPQLEGRHHKKQQRLQKFLLGYVLIETTMIIIWGGCSRAQTPRHLK
jgi:hypothetical protein